MAACLQCVAYEPFEHGVPVALEVPHALLPVPEGRELALGRRLLFVQLRQPLPEVFEAYGPLRVGVRHYTRSARTTRRFSKVGIGVHVCKVIISRPRTRPITHESLGSTTNVSVTL